MIGEFIRMVAATWIGIGLMFLSISLLAEFGPTWEEFCIKIKLHFACRALEKRDAIRKSIWSTKDYEKLLKIEARINELRHQHVKGEPSL